MKFCYYIQKFGFILHCFWKISYLMIKFSILAIFVVTLEVKNCSLFCNQNYVFSSQLIQFFFYYLFKSSLLSLTWQSLHFSSQIALSATFTLYKHCFLNSGAFDKFWERKLLIVAFFFAGMIIFYVTNLISSLRIYENYF